MARVPSKAVKAAKKKREAEAAPVDPPLGNEVDTSVFDDVDSVGPAPDVSEAAEMTEGEEKAEVPETLPVVGASAPATPSVAPSPSTSNVNATPAAAPVEPSAPKMAHASTIQVSKQFTSSGELVSEDDKSEVINVHQFATFPATVGVSLSMTMNLGDYESCKVGVTVSVPTYKEEIDDAYEFAYRTADDKLSGEVEAIRGGGDETETDDDAAPASAPAPAPATPAPATPAASPAPAGKMALPVVGGK